MSWPSLNEYLKEQLIDHKYTTYQAWSTIGCGEKTLRRYVDAGYVTPIKVRDEWYFTEEQIQKCTFISELKKTLRADTYFLAGLYDYLKAHNIKPDESKIIEYTKAYRQ